MLQSCTVVEYSMKIINPISKHFEHNQECFSSGRIKTFTRTNCDLHIKFENGFYFIM